jgi:hypothetical protein
MMWRTIWYGRVRLLPSLALLVMLVVAHVSTAAEITPIETNCDARRCCVCPDYYCPKPLPSVPCAPLGNCDCYQAKPLPCPPCFLHYCAPNDYCPKPSCLYLPPCWPAWYTCGVVECKTAAKR